MTRQQVLHQKTRKLAVWTSIWLLTMAVASFGPALVWAGNTALTIIAIALNTLVGIGMIMANKEHLMSLDELEQRIHLESMGVALGAGLVAGLSYSNMDISNLVSFDAEISHLVIFVSLTYLATLLHLKRRYA